MVRHRLEPIDGQQRRKGSRDEQGDNHRRGDRHAKRLEELANRSAHESDGQKDCHDGESGRRHRQADLVGCRQRGVPGRLMLDLEVTRDVLHIDDRVIDDDADHQRQGEQRDGVELEAAARHHDGRAEQ